MNLDALISLKALEVYEQLKRQQALLATAESCTGGWLAQVITTIPGSSAVFDCGLVTYSNTAKTRLLGVSEGLLQAFGAVSAQTAAAMAEGALVHSQATVSIATTGIAGPTGGTPDKPVGTVWFAWAVRGQPMTTECQLFQGDRANIRAQAVVHAFNGLLKILAGSP